MKLITEQERKIVQKENPKNRLMIASCRKSSGGSSYYLLNDDIKSCSIVAKLRGISVKELLR